MVTAAIKRSIWRTSTRHIGPQVLARILNYYRLNQNDKKNFINAYTKYINAVNNQSRQNARAAGVKLTNTLFKMYEKQARRHNPVSNGFTNGVQASALYWLPGVLFRRALPYRKARSAPTPRATKSL